MASIVKRDYRKILEAALAAPVQPARPSGCGRVYVCVIGPWKADAPEVVAQRKADVAGIRRAAKALGRPFQAKSHYGDRNALYVGYDNGTGYELGKGTAIEKALNAAGIECYRNEHGD